MWKSLGEMQVKDWVLESNKWWYDNSWSLCTSHDALTLLLVIIMTINTWWNLLWRTITLSWKHIMDMKTLNYCEKEEVHAYDPLDDTTPRWCIWTHYLLNYLNNEMAYCISGSFKYPYDPLNMVPWCGFDMVLREFRWMNKPWIYIDL